MKLIMKVSDQPIRGSTSSGPKVFLSEVLKTGIQEVTGEIIKSYLSNISLKL